MQTLYRFSTLEVTKVNTYGIVLRWPGSDPFLLPVLMTAHQGRSILIAHRMRYVLSVWQMSSPWKNPPRRPGCTRPTRGTTMGSSLESNTFVSNLIWPIQENGYGAGGVVTTSQTLLHSCKSITTLDMCHSRPDMVGDHRHAISALVEQGFKPKRSFVWAFGFDEEASGMEVRRTPTSCKS